LSTVSCTTYVMDNLWFQKITISHYTSRSTIY